MHNEIFQYFIIKRIPTESKKDKLSGTITSADSTPKTVICYDRRDGAFIASTMKDAGNNTFELHLPFREDGSLTVLCRDEGGSYNADIYDRLSLCTVDYPMGDYQESLIKDRTNYLLHDFAQASYLNGFLTIPFEDAHQNLKDAIAKISETSTGLELKNSSNAVITNSDIKDALIVNNSQRIIENGDKLSFQKKECSIVHDIFADGKAAVTIPFNGSDIDLGGGTFAFPPKRYLYSTAIGGMCLDFRHTDLEPMLPIFQYKFVSSKVYTMSFWMNYYDYAAGSYPSLLTQVYGIDFAIQSNNVFAFKTGGTGSTWNTAVSYTPTDTIFKKWNHYAIIFNDSFFTLYINGVQKTRVACANISTTAANNNALFWGASYSSTYKLSAKMSMFRIFERALTTPEINTLYAERLTPTIPIVSKIEGTTFDNNILSINGTGLINNTFLHMPINGNIDDKSIVGLTTPTSTGTLVYTKNKDLITDSSLVFDGTSDKFITLGNIPRTYFTENFTMSLWIKFGPEHLTGSNRAILGTNYYNEFQMSTTPAGNIVINFGTAVGTYTTITLTNKIMANEWTHILISVKNTAPKAYNVYINSEQLYTDVTFSYGPSISSTNFLIGSNSQYPLVTNSFIGEIDSLTFFDKILSKDEVVKLYNGNSLKTYKNKYLTSVFSITEDEYHPLKGGQLTSLQITGTTYSQNISFAIEFEKDVFSVYNTVWIDIATNKDTIHGNTGNSNWFYKNSSNQWIEAPGKNKHDAVSLACQYTENRMSITTVNNMSSSIFGQKFDDTTGYANIAVSMITENDYNVPSISKIIYNNKEYWISKEYDLNDYNGLIDSSKIDWGYSEYQAINYSNFIKVFVMITGATTWTQCTRGAAIPGITSATITTGKKMKFKVEWDMSIAGDLDRNKIILDIKINRS